jgi:hypothetical protein
MLWGIRIGRLVLGDDLAIHPLIGFQLRSGPRAAGPSRGGLEAEREVAVTDGAEIPEYAHLHRLNMVMLGDRHKGAIGALRDGVSDPGGQIQVLRQPSAHKGNCAQVRQDDDFAHRVLRQVGIAVISPDGADAASALDSPLGNRPNAGLGIDVLHNVRGTFRYGSA